MRSVRELSAGGIGRPNPWQEIEFSKFLPGKLYMSIDASHTFDAAERS
jgi:hypothetical protein